MLSSSPPPSTLSEIVLVLELDAGLPSAFPFSVGSVHQLRPQWRSCLEQITEP